MQGLLSGQMLPVFFWHVIPTACLMFYSPKSILCNLRFEKYIVKITKYIWLLLLQYHFYTAHVEYSQTFPWLRRIFWRNLDLLYQKSHTDCLGQPEIIFFKHKITYPGFSNSAKSLNCPLNPNFILCKKRLTDIARGGGTTAFNLSVSTEAEFHL